MGCAVLRGLGRGLGWLEWLPSGGGRFPGCGAALAGSTGAAEPTGGAKREVGARVLREVGPDQAAEGKGRHCCSAVVAQQVGGEAGDR